MNRVLIGAAVALFLLVGGALAAPSFIDWNRYRDAIAARVEAAVGLPVVIAGDIDFTLLPSPALSAHEVRVANPQGAAAASLVSLGALDIRVALSPLLRGNIEVRRVVLQEPAFEFEILADGRPNWSLRGGETRADARGISDDLRIDTVLIHNGTVTFRDARRGLAERLSNVDAEITSTTLSGPYLAEGGFTVRGMPIRFSFNSAAATPGRPIALRTDLTLVPEGDKLEFRGQLSEASVAGKLSGTATFDGKNLATLVEKVAQGFQLAPPSIGFAVPVRFTTQAALSLPEIALNDIDLKVGDLNARGAINVALEPSTRIDATVTMGQLDIDALLARSRAGATPAPANAAAKPFVLPADITASLSVAVDATTYRQRLVRGAEVSASIAGGVVTLQRAKAQLPGVSDIDAKGTLIAANGQPQFDGDVTAHSDNFRDLLGWLRIDLGTLSMDRLRTFAYQGKLRLRPDVVQAYGFNLKFDSTEARGAAAYAFRARPAFSLDVDLDRMDVEAYLGRKVGEYEFDLATLDTFDTDFRLRAGELTLADQPAHGVVVDAGLVAGTLTVREATVVDYLGIKGALSGIAQNFSGKTSGTGTVNLAADSPAGLIKLLGRPVEFTPERLGPFAFNASLDGDRDKVTIDAGALVAGTDVRLQGNIKSLGGATGEAPILDLAIEARHGNLPALLQTLGIGAGAGSATPLQVTATLAGPLANLNVLASGTVGQGDLRAAGTVAASSLDALGYTLQVSAAHPNLSAYIQSLGLRYKPAPDLGAAAVRATFEGTRRALHVTALSATVGEAQVAGTAAIDATGARSIYSARLHAGTVPLDRFLPPPVTAAAPRRDWSTEPLPVAFLRTTDLDLDLAVEHLVWWGATYDGAELIARTTQPGVVSLSPMRAAMFGGTVEANATLSVNGVPEIQGTVTARNVDLAAAPKLAWAVVPVSGRMSGSAEVTLRGASEAELMASLSGTGTVTAAGGVLRGIAFGEIGANIDRLKDVAEVPDLLQQATARGETPFRAIDIAARATDGVVALDSLAARVDGAGIAGGGTVDVGRRRTAIELTISLTTHPDAPPIALELSGPWDTPRRLPRSRELQGYVTRRLAAAVPVVPAVPVVTEPAVVAPAPPGFEDQMRGFLQNLAPRP